MKTVIEMAREVGAGEPESLYGRTDYVVMTKFELERFAELVRADKRETWPAQQEPVAVVKALPTGHGHRDMHYVECQHLPVKTKLYIAQPAQREPLTYEEIAAIGKELGLKCRLGGNPNIDFDYARAIEAAHNIKE